MTGLEDALAQVTDRSGTTLRDRLDAESDHVEQLRVTDDTGPLLRRALDHVDRPVVGHEPPGPSDTPSDPSVGEAAGDGATARHERGESPTG